MTGADPDLLAEATSFAQTLGDRLERVLPGVPTVRAVVRSGPRPQVWVTLENPKDPSRGGTVPLAIEGVHRMNLRVNFYLTWDAKQDFLAVTESSITVETLGEGTRAQPLLRYEYEHDQVSSLPAAHLHVHAHRDETTWMMTLGDRRRAAHRNAKGTRPILSDLHFPLGGHRFRPVLEDVLEMVVEEFGVDIVDEHWRSAIREGRQEWRLRQLAAATRDAPMTAAQELRRLGWDVTPPVGVTPDGISPRLLAF